MPIKPKQRRPKLGNLNRLMDRVFALYGLSESEQKAARTAAWSDYTRARRCYQAIVNSFRTSS
jgi:hypothetical protein